MPQQYEVRGLKFLSTSNNMAMSHRCTFAISLRLASGSYWVSHYLFMDDAGYSAHVQLRAPKPSSPKVRAPLTGICFPMQYRPKMSLNLRSRTS